MACMHACYKPHLISPCAPPCPLRLFLSTQVLRKSPAAIYRVHRRVSDLAASLNARTMKLLTTKWMPLHQEVRSRHAALHLPTAEQ